MDLIIKESEKGGKGSYAPRDIKKGESILVFTGKKETEDEIDKKIAETGEETIDDSLQVGYHIFLDLDEKPRLINHSCDPNSGFRGTSELFAIRDIKEGEEITYDYSTTVGAEEDWHMECKCGSDICRKRIGNVFTLPDQTMRKYLELNCLPNHTKVQLMEHLA